MNDPDVIIVTDIDGIRGEVDRAEFEDEDAAKIWVTFDGRRVLVPRDQLTLEKENVYRLPVQLERFLPDSERDSETVVLTVAEETADVRKRVRDLGLVRVRKTVSEDEELIEVPLTSEEVQVERVSIDRVIDGPVPVRQEGDTMILPLIEEVLVVQKQLILREEVHVTKKTRESVAKERVTLRKEEVSVERLDAAEE